MWEGRLVSIVHTLMAYAHTATHVCACLHVWMEAFRACSASVRYMCSKHLHYMPVRVRGIPVHLLCNAQMLQAQQLWGLFIRRQELPSVRELPLAAVCTQARVAGARQA